MSTKIFRVGQKAPPKREDYLFITLEAQGESYDSAALRENALGVYAIFECKASKSNDKAIIFCDDGSDCSLITESGAEKLHAYEVSRGWLDMSASRRAKRSVHSNKWEYPTQYSALWEEALRRADGGYVEYAKEKVLPWAHPLLELKNQELGLNLSSPAHNKLLTSLLGTLKKDAQKHNNNQKTTKRPPRSKQNDQ